ncbi:hypothetical protein A2U01_0111494, partial [Trifolium medium]|nr:hypothetical protein [Trifolium medium]
YLSLPCLKLDFTTASNTLLSPKELLYVMPVQSNKETDD